MYLIFFHDPSFLVPVGTSSEEIEKKVRGKRGLYGNIILLAMLGVSLVTQVFVFPKLTKLYTDLGLEVPFMTQFGTYIFFGATLCFWLVYKAWLSAPSKEPSYTSVKTEEGYLRVTPTVGSFMKAEILIMLGLGLMVGVLIYSTVVPIYSLTNQF